MNSPNSILREMLGESFTAFREEFYLKVPYARSAEPASWMSLADWPVIERLLQHPQVDAIVGRHGERWPGGTPQPQQVPEILQQGYTLGLRHVDRYDQDLAALARRFHDEFAAPVDIHLYATPASHVGFGWHYDAEEVFVLQTRGCKQWWLRKNTVNPWPLIEGLPTDQHYEREIMPALHCRLKPGDWLYIPGGYWHRTQADSESISLSVGIRAWTALDLLDALRPLLAESLRWRQRLPEFDQNPERLKLWIADLADDLACQLQDETFLRRFVERCRDA